MVGGHEGEGGARDDVTGQPSTDKRSCGVEELTPLKAPAPQARRVDIGRSAPSRTVVTRVSGGRGSVGR